MNQTIQPFSRGSVRAVFYHAGETFAENCYFMMSGSVWSYNHPNEPAPFFFFFTSTLDKYKIKQTDRVDCTLSFFNQFVLYNNIKERHF